MDTKTLVIQIDLEIARLQQARNLLAGSNTSAKSRRGRPSTKPASSTPVKKRIMTPEGKARIAAAQKKRWAAQKKAEK